MKFPLLLILLLSHLSFFGQMKTLSGVVTDADNKPMVNCNAFINNSGVGTVTDEAGHFKFSNFGDGSFSLVLSYAGYETYTFTFGADDLPLHLNIRLRKKIVTLANVTVHPPEKDGWEKWGTLFRKCFLGETAAAHQCDIDNSDIIKFYRHDSILEAIAPKFLVIRNHYLGYRIKYQLEKFEFDLKNQRIIYMGYALFEELDSNYIFPAKYPRRVKAYRGSLTHFLRSLYRNSLADEGFEVRRMQRDIHVDTVKNSVKLTARQKRHATHLPPPFRLERHVLDKIGDSLLTRDSLLERDQNGAPALFAFDDFLKIDFFKEPESEEYQNHLHKYQPLKSQVSRLFISNVEKRIQLSSNGFYFPSLDLSMEGYFGWERVGDLLPVEYEAGPPN